MQTYGGRTGLVERGQCRDMIHMPVAKRNIWTRQCRARTHTDIERDIRILNTLRQQTGKNYYNMNCQLAVMYIQAMDAR